MEAKQNEIDNKHKGLKKLKDSKLTQFLKKYALKLILPAALVLILTITLLVCFVGVRGVYVSADNPNNYYEFTANSYKCVSEDEWGEISEEGKWKVSGGKIIFSVKDEDFGNISDDFKFSRKGFKTIFIDEEEYNRVSIVGTKMMTKIKVDVDLQGGQLQGVKSQYKFKPGSKSDVTNSPQREGFSFAGWYSSQYGFFDGEEQLSFDNKFWEKCTVYANWTSNKKYSVSASEN